MTQVDLIDPGTGTVLTPIYPVDKSAHASALRRIKKPGEAPPPAPAGMAPLLKKLLSDFEETGLPPPYLSDEEELS